MRKIIKPIINLVLTRLKIIFVIVGIPISFIHADNRKACQLTNCVQSCQQSPTVPTNCQSTSQWPSVNHDLCNSLSNPFVTIPSTSNVSQLSILWSTALPTSTFPVQGAPVILNGVVYYADIVGNIYARNLDTGALIWQQTIAGSEFDGPLLVTNDRVYAVPNNANLYALDIQTGNIIYTVPVDPSAPAGQVTCFGGMNTVDDLIFVPLSGAFSTEGMSNSTLPRLER